MGYGYYSLFDREKRAVDLGYKTKSAKEIFKQNFINKDMNPNGVLIRESRDSNEHPESFSIIIGLDHTGSMGIIPHYLVKEGLPFIMKKIMENGINDPQLLFLGIGDHKVDSAPLQIGQFESSDELNDKWLTSLYLEGGGGGNGGESYLLAWYFASKHTSIDCLEKRTNKGVLITIGDEPTHKSIPIQSIKKLMGEKNEIIINEGWENDKEELNALDLLNSAMEKYDVYHIHIKSTKQGQIQKNIDDWKEIIGDGLYIAENKDEVPQIISEIIKNSYSKQNNLDKIFWYKKGKIEIIL